MYVVYAMKYITFYKQKHLYFSVKINRVLKLYMFITFWNRQINKLNAFIIRCSLNFFLYLSLRSEHPFCNCKRISNTNARIPSIHSTESKNGARALFDKTERFCHWYFFSCTLSWTKRQDVPWRRKGWQKCIREGNNAAETRGYADYSMECNLNCTNVIIALVGFITVTVNNSTHISHVSNHFSAVSSWFTTKFCKYIMLAKHNNVKSHGFSN